MSTAVFARARTASLYELWHLASFDAPSVAVLWLMLFTPPAHRDWHAAAALGLAVWILYVADRLLDAHFSRDTLEERHRFHALHRSFFVAGIVVAVTLLAFLLPQVRPDLRTAWLLLSIPLVLYLGLVHATNFRLPKETLVAAFFSAACAMPALIAHQPGALLQLSLFAMPCWLNCIMIAVVETRSWEDLGDFNRLTAKHFQYICGVVIAASLCAALAHRSALLLAVVIATAALSFVYRGRARFSALQVRILADAALLAPLLLLMLW